MKKTFTYFRFLALSTVMLFMSVSVFAADYYWVGGSGSWSQFATHWATSSGGTSFHTQVPTANDNVYFDANSFSASGQTVNANNTVVFFKDMDWTGATNNPEFLQTTASSSINIFGSFTLISAMNFNIQGALVFLSNSTGNTITTAGNTIPNRIDFDGSGGEWTLTDDLSIAGSVSSETYRGRLNLNFGTLKTDGNDVTCLGFLSNGGNTRKLDLSNSTLTINSSSNYQVYPWQSNTSNFTFTSTSSKVIVNHTYPYYGYFNAYGLTFNEFEWNGTATVNGNNSINSNLTFNGKVSINTLVVINGSNTYNDEVLLTSDCIIAGNSTFNNKLVLSPGGTFVFNAGTTQTFSSTGDLEANGTCVAPINIKTNTSGSQSTFYKVGGDLDVDQVVMQDINATFSSTSYSANATNSFDGGNNSNWTFPAASGASMYWIGGTGNWDDPSHWSTTSGGSAGSCIPTPSNDVKFDANSFSSTGQTVTINVSSANCKSMDWTGATNTPSFNTTSTNNKLNIYGSLKFISAMNMNMNAAIYFESSATGNTITSAGKNFPGYIYFNGVGGEWSLADAMTTNSYFYLNNGTFNTNNFNLNFFYLNSQNNNTRVMNLGSSTVTCYYWIATGSNMTVNAGTSTIKPSYYFYGNNLTYYNLTIDFIYFSTKIYSGATFNGDVTCLSGAGFEASCTYNGSLILSPGQTYTFGQYTTQTISSTGTLDANGSCDNYITMESTQAGVQATIAKVGSNITVDYVILQDLIASVDVGYLAFATNKSVDNGNNTNWNITANTSTSLYWVGGSGNWDDPSHWSTTSGGSGGSCIPSPLDDVYFDANSFTSTSKNVSINVSSPTCRSMDWTGSLHSPVFQQTIGSTLRIFGSLKLISNMTFSVGTVNFEAKTSGNSITMAGKTINGQVNFRCEGGSYILQDDFKTGSLIELYAGSLNTNNYNVDCYYFYSYSGRTRALVLGSSVVTINGIYWYVTSSNMTLNSGTSTIRYANPTTNYPFYGGGFSYYNLTFETGNAGSKGTISSFNNTFNGTVTFKCPGEISSSNTFNGNVVMDNIGTISSSNTFNKVLKLTSGFEYKFGAYQTQTFGTNGSFVAVGSPCAPISLSSTTNGVASTLSKSSGEICTDYLYLNGIKTTGGATFSSGLNSTNSTPTIGTGWSATACSVTLQSSIISQSAPLCGSGSVVLSARNATSYTWSTGATTQSITISSGGTYSVTIENLNGCVESGSVTVTSGSPPSCSISGTASTCPSASETYTAPSGMADYAWSISGNGNVPGSAIGQNVNVVPTACGSYTVTLNITNSDGCVSTCTASATVVDNTAPTITCPSNITTSTGTGLCSKNVSFSVTASDNCGTPTIVSSPASGSLFQKGTTTVTSTATDACGNTDVCTFTVTVEDDEAPVLTCANVTIYPASGQCTASTTLTAPTASDNCGTYGSFTNDAPSTYPMGNTTVTWSSTDLNSNTGTCEQVVTVADIISPTALAKNATIYLNSNGSATLSPASIDDGSSDDCSSITLSLSKSSFTCQDLGSNSVTLTVTDAGNNTDAATATVTVKDIISPTITCASNVSGTTSASSCNVSLNVGTPTAADNCAVTSLVNDYNNTADASDNYPIGETIVTWTATDASGNSETCTQTVTVYSPEIDVTGNGNAITDGSTTTSLTNDTDFDEIVPSVSETKTYTIKNIGTSDLTVSTISLSGSGSSNFSVGGITLPATITSGNSATFTVTFSGTSITTYDAVVTIANTDCNEASYDFAITAEISCVAPTVTSCQYDMTESTTSTTCDVNYSFSPSFSGTPTPSISYEFSGETTGSGTGNGSGSTFNLGVTTIEVTATNACGSATCSFDLTVIDNTPPTAVTKDVTAYLDQNGAVTVYASDINDGSTDNCGVDYVKLQDFGTICQTVNEGYALTMTAPSGKVFTSINFASYGTPTGSCGSFATGSCHATNSLAKLENAALGNNSFTINATNSVFGDPCGGTYKRLYVQATYGSSSTPQNSLSFDCDNIGDNDVELAVTDVNGNVSLESATITVVDNSDPVAAAKNATVYLNASGAASITTSDIDNGSDDNCTFSLSLDKTAFNCGETGTNTVTLTVTDASGNTDTETATVTVVDNIAPTAATQNVTIYLDANGEASISTADIDNGSDDNCTFSLSLDKTAFDCSETGTNTVTLTVTDASGNTDTETATVTVVDNIAPTAATQNVTIYLDANGEASISTADIDNGSDDNCTFTLSLDKTAFDCDNVGTNTVTLTVTDASGNTDTETATVTVVDNIAPTAATQNVTIYLDANGEASISTTDIDNGSDDNCTFSLSLDKTDFGCSETGTNTVTLTVTDASGNTDTETATVTVVDNIAPTAATQNATIYLDANGEASISTTDIDNGSDDNCTFSLSLDKTDFGCSETGTNTVTLTVTDASGNTDTETATVTVVDNIDPTAICQNTTVTLSNGNASITTGDINNGSNDACGILSLSLDNSAFDCDDIGNNNVTMTVTDNNNNESTCTSTVTVDGVIPTATIASSANTSGTVIGGTTTYAATNQMFIGYGAQSMNITATASGGSSFTYSWTGSGLSSTSVSNPVFTPTQEGNYTLTCTVTNNYGCEVTSSITICVINAKGNGGNANNPKVLICHRPSGNPNNTQNISVSVNAVTAHLGNHGGCTLGACGSSCSSLNSYKVGGEEALEAHIYGESHLEVMVYPNPSRSEFNFILESPTDEMVSLKVFDIQGQLLTETNNLVPNDEHSFGTELISGVYMVVIKQGDFVKATRVVKIN